MECTITTPEELVFDGGATSVVVPAVDGEMGFLPRHAPLIGTLGSGELRVTESAGGAKRRFFVQGGFVQVLEDRVTVLAVAAQSVEKLDAAAERRALERLSATRPAPGASIEARDEFQRAVDVAKLRVRLSERR